MSDCKAAAEAASNLANMYRSVLIVQSVLDKVGDLENYKKTAEQANAAAQETLAATRAQLAELQAEVSSYQNELDAKTAEAKAIVDRATDEAAAIIQQANDQAARYAADQEGIVAFAIAALTGQKDSLQDDVVQLKVQIGNLTQDRDALVNEIASLKAKFS